MSEPSSGNTMDILREIRGEIRNIKHSLYGNPAMRDKGLFDRLEKVEEMMLKLERDSIEKGQLAEVDRKMDEIEKAVAKLGVDQRVAAIWWKAVAAGTGSILVTLLAAAAVAVFNFLTGIGGG